MSVTRDQIISAYRIFLGREPESEAVVEGFMYVSNITDLRNIFTNSREYKDRYGFHPHLRAFLDAPAQVVEVKATEDEERRMLARIGAAWSAFGDDEPHWSVLVGDEFKSDRIADNIDYFYETGFANVAFMMAMAERAGAKTTGLGRALDYGCGVGRLTLALKDRAQYVTGVDISRGHLALARQRAAEKSIDTVEFHHLTSVGDLDRWHRTQDLVISLIVLQHNPPPIMAVIFRKLLDALAPGGVAVIQLPTFFFGQDFRVAEYLGSEQPQMEMNALPQRHVFEIIAETGCRTLEVREDDSNGVVPGVSQIFVVARPAD